MWTKIQIGIVSLLLASCGNSFDPEKVNIGMSSDQLIEAVGEPDERLPMMSGMEFWRYEDDHTVMVSDGEVLNVGIMTDADYERTMQQLETSSAPEERYRNANK